MKTILKCLTLILLLPNLLTGQSKPAAKIKPNVDFDFPSWTVERISPVRHDSLSSIRIKNINTLLYKVSIKGEQVVLSTSSSDTFNSLFRIEDPGKAASEASEGLGEAQKAKEEMQGMPDKVDARARPVMESLVASCKSYIEAADRVLMLKSRRAELTSLAKFPWPNYDSLMRKLPPPLLYAEIQRDIQNFQNAYGRAEAKYEDAKAATKDTVLKKQIENALEVFEEGYNKIDEDDLMKLADDISALQNVLSNDAFLTAWGPPVQADDCDFIRYSIVAESPKDGSQFLPAASFQPISVDIPVKGGWKADFSVGLNFSAGDGALDGKYRFEPPVNGQSKLVKTDNNNFVRPGIATMLHAYRRTGYGYAFGFLLGLGADFKEENTLSASYYLGGSLVLGKSQRIIINTGLGILSVDRLKSDYQADKSYAIDPEDLPELTEKALRPAFFLGISYNITNRSVKK